MPNDGRDFLFEIGTEEMPPKQINNLVEALAARLKQGIENLGLKFSQVKTFATPRRLAVLIYDLSSKQPDQEVEMRGPAVKVAFDAAGNPTVAAKKFAESCGVNIDALKRFETAKGSWLICKTKKIGQNTAELLPTIVANALKNLPMPRAMRWGFGKYTFVRPVHSLVMLFGNVTIQTEFFGIKTSNQTYGHHFLHPAAITITEPKQYAEILKQNYVIADFAERRDLIVSKIKDALKNIKNAQALISAELLDEVTGLVEWPVALIGSFPENFLELPPEVLITTLEHQQRYFPIVDENQKLIARFVVISNLASKNPAQVIAGNERVINARLTDAEFFYHTDLKFSLDSYLEQLSGAVFQAKLGSIYDKTLRVGKIAMVISKELEVNQVHVARAVQLSKCDLMTTMVGEFPELQGVMGYYYALKQNEPEPVAKALLEQYLPRFAEDKIPESKIGAALAIADRLDTLVGMFGINKLPTGEKDPLGLRRAAIGVIRIIIEMSLNLDLVALLELAKQNYAALALENTAAVNQVLDFIYERLRSWYLDQGGKANIFNAVVAKRPSKLLDFKKRLDAVNYFQNLPDAEALSMAEKRVNNILQKASIKTQATLNPKLFKEIAEKELASAIEKLTPALQKLFRAEDYQAALYKLTEIKPAIDNFFDQVMVMVDDEKIRRNRLRLLSDLHELFNYIADISLL